MEAPVKDVAAPTILQFGARTPTWVAITPVKGSRRRCWWCPPADRKFDKAVSVCGIRPCWASIRPRSNGWRCSGGSS